MTRILVWLIALGLTLCVAAPAQESPPQTPSDPARITALIAQLGHRQYAEREAASAALVALGVAALPQLREAAQSADLEISERARRLVTELEAAIVFGLGEFRARRVGLAPGSGVDEASERAVMLGLTWLSAHQDDDGKWSGSAFMARDPADDACTGPAKMSWVDPGITGLATLAFLAAGSTHRGGEFRENVKKAIQYLLKIQGANGLIGGQRGHYLYNHAICSLALVEAYSMTKSPLIKGAASKSVEYLISARNPGRAWRYAHRDGDSDVSVTGWCLTALACAKDGGLEIEGLDEAQREAGAWLESVTDGTWGVSGYKVAPPQGWRSATSSRFQNDELAVNTAISHSSNHTPTAIATFGRALLRYRLNDPRVISGADAVANMVPDWDEGGGGRLSKVDYYYWYYASLAMYQVGGELWTTWNRATRAALVGHQRRSGSAAGSWDPIDAWGFAGGRVYATAINVLTLETPYRYPRTLR